MTISAGWRGTEPRLLNNLTIEAEIADFTIVPFLTFFDYFVNFSFCLLG
jgi:hypothetical protein